MLILHMFVWMSYNFVLQYRRYMFVAWSAICPGNKIITIYVIPKLLMLHSYISSFYSESGVGFFNSANSILPECIAKITGKKGLVWCINSCTHFISVWNWVNRNIINNNHILIYSLNFFALVIFDWHIVQFCI